MKKLFILAALTGALASQTFAFTVDVSRMSGYYFGNGGEATITGMPASDPAFQAVLHNYSPLTSSSSSFQTFCINTSISVQANPQNATLDNSGVSMGAAWLYNQFARGLLAYSYVPGATRVASAGALQDAIWYLEGQVAVPTLGAGYVAIVDGLFTPAGALAPSGGAFNVEALRLTHDGIVSQPMLALVPDGGSTILLLGFARAASVWPPASSAANSCYSNSNSLRGSASCPLFFVSIFCSVSPVCFLKFNSLFHS